MIGPRAQSPSPTSRGAAGLEHTSEGHELG